MNGKEEEVLEGEVLGEKGVSMELLHKVGWKDSCVSRWSGVRRRG